MPRTTRDYYHVYPVRTATGEEDISIRQDPNWPRTLSPRLHDPLVVDGEAFYQKLIEATDEAARDQVANSLIEKQKSEMRERMQLVSQLFEDKDADAEYWKHLAFALLRQFVPGLSIAVVLRADPKPRLMTEEYVAAVVAHVRAVWAKLQAGRSKKLPKVPQQEALRQVYKNWPKQLGRKPPTFGAWEVLYHRCKNQYVRLNMPPS